MAVAEAAEVMTGGSLTATTRTETVWFDAPRRLARFRRCTRVTPADGSVVQKTYEQQKHPVSRVEVQTWSEHHGFVVERMYGDRAGTLYTETSDRAIFWARLKP